MPPSLEIRQESSYFRRQDSTVTAEAKRLEQIRARVAPWQKWGPYLSERQWGTVREDYSSDGNAWSYFPHDQARSPLASLA